MMLEIKGLNINIAGDPDRKFKVCCCQYLLDKLKVALLFSRHYYRLFPMSFVGFFSRKELFKGCVCVT